jgi:hypothetical protein
MTSCRTLVIGLLAGAGALTLVAVAPQPSSAADVCASAGRRISVSACGDPIERWAMPPAAYAPLPEDFDAAPPPPPPPPHVNVCANVGRRISVSGCF